MTSKQHIHPSKKGRPRPALLVILDGFGLADPMAKGNAITKKTASHIFEYMDTYPTAELNACGEAVGLFSGQAGNSEAGHLNIGAGRLIKQDLLTISEAVENGTFYKNEAFRQGLLHAKKHRSNVHVMGLLTDGNSAHSHPDHVYGLLEFFRRNHYNNVFLHLFTDGRDSTPHSSVHYLKLLRDEMRGNERIASVTGRFYAMDRAKNWSRTQRAYHSLVLGEGLQANSAEDAIAAAYNRGESDEFIQPTVIMNGDKPLVTIEDNDVVFFFNARSDRARQLSKVFLQNDFQKRNKGAFRRKRRPKNIRFVAMTDFGPNLPGMLTAFPSPDYENCLPSAIGEGYRQLYISETEKYAHVTYFLNGGYDHAVYGESRELMHSSDDMSFADHPALNSRKVTKKIIAYLKDGAYDFVTVNFPNADMVGHTGDIKAARTAVEIVDQCVHELVEAYLQHDGLVVVTADHGNAEDMLDEKTGEALTEHTCNLVPCILIGKELKGTTCKSSGKLADVAPTLLQLMGIKKPSEMTGRSLV